MVVYYFLIVFSNFVLEAELKYQIGSALLIFIGFVIAVNLLYNFVVLIKDYRRSKLYYKLKKLHMQRLHNIVL
jgi:hypothetical protein